MENGELLKTKEGMMVKMEADRSADNEHFKQIMETISFSSRQTGCLAIKDVGQQRSKQDHGFEGKS
jgi:DNA-binding cell septation regulator SpoVG